MSSGFQPTLSFIQDQSNNQIVEDDYVIALKSKLENDPYHYNLHVSLLDYLQIRGNKHQLRKARETMQSIFPLSSKLWLSWLQDELTDETETINETTTDDTNKITINENKTIINALFEKALLDQPFSPQIWLKYLKYSCDHLNLNPTEMGGLFERAIFTAGYDLIAGATIFEYLNEQLLKNITINSQTVMNDTEKTYFSDLYAIRLKIPHLDATLNAFSDYEIFNQQLDLPINLTLTQEHTKILDVYTKVESYLRILSDDPAPNNFRELINFFSIDEDALDCRDTDLIVEAIYELFLSYNEVDVDIWREYIHFLLRYSDDQIETYSVYKRAIRFIPWDVVVWCNYLYFVSNNQSNDILMADNMSVDTVLNKAIQIGFNFAEQYLLLYQAYISHYINHGTVHETIDAFQSAFEFFIKNYGEQCSALMFLYELKGDYLLIKAKDGVNYIDFWDTLLQIEEPDNQKCKHFPAHIWINYTKQLLNMDLMDNAMRVMNTSLNRVHGSDLPSLVATYVNFTLIFEEKNYQLIDTPSNINTAISSIVKYNWYSAYKQQPAERYKKKREIANKEHIKKPQKRVNSTSNSNVDSDGFKVPTKSLKSSSTLQPTSSTTTNKNNNTDKSIITANKIDHNKNDHDKNIEKSTDASADLSNIEKIPKERKEKTVFLSNISFDADESALKNVFDNCGDVVEVRLAKSRTDRSKGYGYLEFTSEESVKKALLLDRTLVNNRPLYVSPCIDKTKESIPFKYNTDLSANTLFISKLSKETTLEKLKEVFNKLSENIKEIRLVTNRSGKSKGYAYMEMNDGEIASKTILMYDGTQIDGATISIDKSNPPKRKELAVKKETANLQHKNETNNRGLSRQKTRLMVVNNADNATVDPSKASDAAARTNTKLTNKNFRDLFK